MPNDKHTLSSAYISYSSENGEAIPDLLLCDLQSLTVIAKQVQKRTINLIDHTILKCFPSYIRFTLP
jgi:hypothetical protein